MDNSVVIIYVWLSILTLIYFGRILFKNWKAKKINLFFNLGALGANTELERIKKVKKELDKSAGELKEFEKKEEWDKETIKLVMKVVSDYKNLVEKQQILLGEKKKRVKLEEKVKSLEEKAWKNQEKSVKDCVDLIWKFREEMEKVDKKLRKKFCSNCKNEFEKIFKY